jgi:biopolymer transport protein ExbD
MAIPPIRWVGFAFLLGGLSLLFDTYAFLRTDWSPFRVPMFAPDELALGYFLAGLGVAMIFVPVLMRATDSIAPDASMKLGVGLAHPSVEVRRQRRLPLGRKFTGPPNRGLVGGAMILMLLLPVFLMVTEHELGKGIYVRLVPRHSLETYDRCLRDQIVVTVQKRGFTSALFVNGVDVDPGQLEQVLKRRLAERPYWQVFVEGDDELSFADPMSAIDAINALQARAVILTPQLKRQMARTCPSR